MPKEKRNKSPGDTFFRVSSQNKNEKKTPSELQKKTT